MSWFQPKSLIATSVNGKQPVACAAAYYSLALGGEGVKVDNRRVCFQTWENRYGFAFYREGIHSSHHLLSTAINGLVLFIEQISYYTFIWLISVKPRQTQLIMLITANKSLLDFKITAILNIIRSIKQI